MPGLRESQAIQLPPPYSGQMDMVPVVSLQSPYCDILENFNTTDQGLTLRKGDQRATAYTGVGNIHVGATVWMDSLSKLFVLIIDDGGGGSYVIKDYLAGTTPYTLAGYTGSDGFAFPVQFGGYLFLFGDAELATTHGGIYYNGAATWGNNPYTLPGGFYPIIGEGHRHRMYLVAKDNTQRIAYGGVDAVAGAVTSYSLSGVLPSVSPIYLIKSFSISDTQTTRNLLAIGTRSGDIVVYDGSYPASADWTIVGRFKIPEILWYQSFIEYQGDALIMTRSGLVSLRDLFVRGPQGAFDSSISRPINTRWKQIMGGLSTFYSTIYTCGVWDQDKNRIVISFFYYIDRSGNATGQTFFLVYDIERQAWTEHIGAVGTFNALRMCYRPAFGVYFGTNLGWLFIKEGQSTSYKDPDYTNTLIPFSYRIRSAPIPKDRYQNARVSGLEFISTGDWYGVTNIRLRGDIGRVISGDVKLPSQGSTMVKPFVSIGVDSTVVQWEIEKDTSNSSPGTNGCNIYGVNVQFESGGAR